MQALLIEADGRILPGLRSTLSGKILDIHIEHVQKGVRGTMRIVELEPMEKNFTSFVNNFQRRWRERIGIKKLRNDSVSAS